MSIAGATKDIFTEKDGVSFCPVRTGFVCGLVAFFAFTLHDVFYTDNFHFMEHASDWMKGLADYLGFGGAAIAGKSYTEPSA